MKLGIMLVSVMGLLALASADVDLQKPGEAAGWAFATTAEAADARGWFCESCSVTSTCDIENAIACTILSACSQCTINVAEEECGFSFNPFASCTVDPAANCGDEVLGVCMVGTGICVSTGVVSGPCGTVTQCTTT